MSEFIWPALQDAGQIVVAYLVAAALVQAALRLQQRGAAAPGARWPWRLGGGLSLVAAVVLAQQVGQAPLARAAAESAGLATAFGSAALGLVCTSLALWIAANLSRLGHHRQPPARWIAAIFAALAILLLDYAGLAAADVLDQTGVVGRIGAATVALLAVLLMLGLQVPLRAAVRGRHARRRMAERQRLAEQERARLLALRDPLTGLGNRTAFQQEVAEFIREANRRGGRFDFYHCDIGFATGTAPLLREQALAVLATRLRAATRADDRLIHYGDGQFVLLCARTGSGREARSTPVRERLLAACGELVRIEAARLTVAAEIGLATYPQDGATARQLMSAAMRAGHEQRVVSLHSSAA